MPITAETAKQDLEKVLGQFKTIGPGTEQDRAAQLVLQTLGVLQRRLGSPQIIKMLYLDNAEARILIPETVYTVASQYVGGQMTRQDAEQTLIDAIRQYEQVFAEAGIKPARSATLFR